MGIWYGKIAKKGASPGLQGVLYILKQSNGNTDFIKDAVLEIMQTLQYSVENDFSLNAKMKKTINYVKSMGIFELLTIWK